MRRTPPVPKKARRAPRHTRDLAGRLQATAQAVSESLDLDVVLPAILDELRRVVAYDSSSIQLLEGEAMRVIAVRGLPDSELGRVRPLAAYPYNRALATGAEPIVLDRSAFAEWWRKEPHMAGIRSNIGVPLVVRDRVIGALTLDSHRAGRYTQGHARTAMAFARQAAIAIENARLFGEERAARERSERLQAATRALLDTRDLPGVLAVILRELRRVVPHDSATVQELSGHRLQVIGGSGFADAAQVLGLGFDLSTGDYPNLERVVRTRAPLVLDDAWSSHPGFRREPHAQAKIRSWLGVPLLFRDHLIGVLTLDKKEAGFYTEDHVRLALAFAAHASIAIENARLYAAAQEEIRERARAEETLRRARDELEQRVGERTAELFRANEALRGDIAERAQTEEALRRARDLAERLQASAQVVSESLDLDVVLPAILDELRRVIDYDSSTVQLLEQDAMRVIAVRGLPVAEVGRVRRLADHPYNRALAGSPEPIILPHAPTDGLWTVESHMEEVRSNIGVPLVVRDRVIGALTVDSHQPGRYTEEDARTAVAFARQAAIAIENARLFGQEHSARDEAERLRAATQALSASIELDQVLALILSELQRVVPSDSASVQELRGRKLVVVGGHGFRNRGEIVGMAFDVDQEPNAQVVRSRASFIVGDAPAHYPSFRRPFAVRTGVRSWLGVPLLFGDRLIGMLALDKKEPGYYGEHHGRLALAFAAQAAIAIEHARLYAAARDSEARSRESAEEWQRTFDAVESPLLILDRGGRLRRLNGAARAALGRAGSRILGQRLERVASGQPWAEVAGIAATLSPGRASCSTQVRDEATDRAWELSASLSPEPEERIIVVVREITALAKLQESLRRSETLSAMGSLVAGVAHEVRNPLFAISANLDAFEARFGTRPEYAQTIGLLRTELDRLGDLMRDLLDYGRPVQGKPAPGSVEEVMAEAAHASAALGARTSVAIVRRVAARLPPVVMERHRLVQAFQNLIQNALQHSPRGGTVALGAETEAVLGGHWVRCAVLDSGPGFRSEDLPRLFEPFFSRRRGGTGMGLAIAQRIVEAHGGRIIAANRPEGGAAMVVKLPYVP